MKKLANLVAMLIVVDVSEVKEAKDGRSYFTVSFSPGYFQKIVKRTFWEQFKRDPKTGELTNETYWERITPEQAEMLKRTGEPIEGRKATNTVESYIIGENEVDQYSTVVFPDENEVTVFAAAGHPILDEETGELKQPKKAVISAKPKNAAPEEEEEEEEQEEEVKPKAAPKSLASQKKTR